MGAQTWASLGEVVGKRCILKAELAGVVDVFFSKPSSGFPFHLAQKSKPRRGPWGPLIWPRLPRLPPSPAPLASSPFCEQTKHESPLLPLVSLGYQGKRKRTRCAPSGFCSNVTLSENPVSVVPYVPLPCFLFPAHCSLRH